MPYMNARNSFYVPQWLTDRLSAQRQRLGRLIAGLRPTGSLTPAGFARFQQMMRQVEAEQAEEQRILDRIAGLEAQHRYRQEQGQLVSARATAEGRDSAPLQWQDSDKPLQGRTKKRGIFWWLVLAALLRPKAK